MASFDQDLRAALQLRAKSISGFPTIVQHEGTSVPPAVLHTPTSNNPYARLFLMRTGTVPFNVQHTRFDHRGLFRINLYGPDGRGSGTLEALASHVRDQFTATGPKLSVGTTDTLVVEAVQPGGGGQAVPVEDGWAMVVVEVLWRCISRRK